MSASATLHVRVDQDAKARVSEALDAMGMSMSEAASILLRRAVEDWTFPWN